MGYAIFISAFFTALSDGVTSATISFLRTLVFEIAAILILPLVFDVNGIWLSVVFAEFTAVTFSLIFLFAKRKKYKY
jgi:Na+-driven multidrug efflux pump